MCLGLKYARVNAGSQGMRESALRTGLNSLFVVLDPRAARIELFFCRQNDEP